ncbi:hypothetical protein [Alkalimarinus alittae]|uniref:Wadjet protein JetD C-terminal domain-containing protein n=1 Tax=Alkalimarinus alittae TaxID=2961619 RepID=A0ABY6N5G7_9ALTE|nr:hypothetical protein [Alkalimarinus alittae]UZE97232.1 hypothetical protein NKI27_05645 [Alkalimarinus alittae]
MEFKKLARYLQKISSERPIDLGAFYRLLNTIRLDVSFSQDEIRATKVKGNKYIVTYLPPSLKRCLEQIARGSEAETRSEAAVQNNSHSVKVNGSFLIIRKGVSDPKIIVFDGDGNLTKDYARADTALLIENRQNFLNISETLEFLADNSNVDFGLDIDVIFTSGNEVSNSLHSSFLRQYKELFLFLDLDLGGLQIAANIMVLTDNYQHQFIVPDDIEKRLERVQTTASPEHIDKVIEIGVKFDALAPFARLIKKHRKTIEQESFLHVYEWC